METIGEIRKKYKINRITEIVTRSAVYPSNCFEITFVNNGTTSFTVLGFLVTPTNFVTFGTNTYIDDNTGYELKFSNDFAGNNCSIIRGYLTEK
jgi:hypothetical protein